MASFVFTSESVTEGHPDKICDQISDAILDAVLKYDPMGRVACETFVTTGMVLVGGEITTSTYVDIPEIVRGTILDIGYNDSSFGFDGNSCAVMVTLDKQSPDIAQGVNRQGAGDQGMMFGFATDETKEMMPLPIMLAHKLTARLAELRHNKTLSFLRPDGKSQVSVRYQDNKPVAVETVVISTQHSERVSNSELKEGVINEIIKPVIPESMVPKEGVKYHINPTGRFVIGGPQGDSGLTGRKLMVDTYGGVCPHGGGAFSGKDPTKVDRSAAYAVRWIAKNIVAAGLATRCQIQIAYAIGVAEPVSIFINTFGTGVIPDEEIVKLIKKNFDLTPSGIIESLKLRNPIYKKTAVYGHFGRSEPEFTWEQTDRMDDLKRG